MPDKKKPETKAPPNEYAVVAAVARDVENLRKMLAGETTSTLKGSGSILDQLGGINAKLAPLAEAIAKQTMILASAQRNTTAAIEAQTKATVPLLESIDESLALLVEANTPGKATSLGGEPPTAITKGSGMPPDQGGE